MPNRFAPLARSPAALALLALALGLLVGALAGASDAPALRALPGLVEPLGALWVNAIRMTLVPLVVSLLVTGVASAADVRAVGRLGARALGAFVVLLLGAALFAALLAPPLFDRMPLDPAGAAALRASAAPADTAAAEIPTARGFVVGLVPTNVVAAAAGGAMLPLIVFTLIFALAAARAEPRTRDTVVGLFRAVGDVMLTVVRWVLAVTPVGVFALSVDLGATLGLGAAGAVGYYVLVLSGLVLVATLLLYPAAALAGRVSLGTFARACLPAQAMAVATRSSLASLPGLIAGARQAFGDRPAITGFVLPLAVSTFKVNTPIADLAGPLFLAALYGVDVTPAQVAVMTGVSVLMSFSNPGIPSGGLFVVTAPVMLSVGLPLEGIGILIAADAIPDIFNTLINVTGDMAVATALAPDAPEVVEVVEAAPSPPELAVP